MGMENPIEMDDLGIPPFQETSISAIPGHYIMISTCKYHC